MNKLLGELELYVILGNGAPNFQQIDNLNASSKLKKETKCIERALQDYAFLNAISGNKEVRNHLIKLTKCANNSRLLETDTPIIFLSENTKITDSIIREIQAQHSITKWFGHFEVEIGNKDSIILCLEENIFVEMCTTKLKKISVLEGSCNVTFDGEPKQLIEGECLKFLSNQSYFVIEALEIGCKLTL